MRISDWSSDVALPISVSSADGIELAPWQQRIYTQAAAAIDSGRLGHALLFRGPARLGKGTVARALARRLLCESRNTNGDACGRCRGCQLFAAGSHPDFHAVSFIAVKDGTRLRSELIVEIGRA